MRFVTCLLLSAIFLIGSYQWLMHHSVQHAPRAIGGLIFIFLMAAEMPGSALFYAALWMGLAVLFWLLWIAVPHRRDNRR